MNRDFGLRSKRLFDLLVASLFLLLFSPLIICISIGIWLTMGAPILFHQKRLGQGGREFEILKFRTMNETRDGEGNLLPDGQRLTIVGRFLRTTTMDEIPELINVLRGEMSLIGPRPLLVDYRDLYTPGQWRRHLMPPGMGGPVLAGGRNALTWDEKFDLDLWYVDNWSFWLDIKILVATAVKVVKREGVSSEGHATMPPFTGTQAPPE